MFSLPGGHGDALFIVWPEVFSPLSRDMDTMTPSEQHHFTSPRYGVAEFGG